jgi:hypothetical protein
MSGLIEADPVHFIEALNSSRIYAGDTLLLKDGTYTGNWVVKWSGTQAAPITIKPLHPGMVTIDGSLIMGAWQTWRDLDFTDSGADRTISTPGITMNYAGCQLIGCYVHDLRSSGVSWFGSGVGAVKECRFKNNGFLHDGSGAGHAIYTHNNGGGLREISRNLFEYQMGAYTIHIYSEPTSSSPNYLRDYWVNDNLILQWPVHCGGGKGLKNLLFENNIHLEFYCQIGRYNVDGYPDDGIIRNNTWIGINGLTIHDWELGEFTISGNIANTDLAPSPAFSPAPGIVYGPTPANYSVTIPFTESVRWSGMTGTLAGGVYTAQMNNI